MSQNQPTETTPAVNPLDELRADIASIFALHEDPRRALLMAQTGFSSDDIDDLGGMPEESHDHR